MPDAIISVRFGKPDDKAVKDSIAALEARRPVNIHTRFVKPKLDDVNKAIETLKGKNTNIPVSIKVAKINDEQLKNFKEKYKPGGKSGGIAVGVKIAKVNTEAFDKKMASLTKTQKKINVQIAPVGDMGAIVNKQKAAAKQSAGAWEAEYKKLQTTITKTLNAFGDGSKFKLVSGSSEFAEAQKLITQLATLSSKPVANQAQFEELKRGAMNAANALTVLKQKQDNFKNDVKFSKTLTTLASQLENFRVQAERAGRVNEYNDLLERLQRASQDSSISVEQLARDIQQFGLSLRQSASPLQSFIGGFDQLFTKITGLNFANWARRTFTKACKEIYNSVKEVNKALTDFQIVAGASDKKLGEFTSSAFDISQRISANFSDIADAATVFRRLGYSVDDSLKLSEMTTMFSRIGNVGVSDAENAATAVLKAFDMTASDLQLAMDKMVMVGNNFPISAAQIGEALNNASSALAAGGNNFDQTIALLTAANATVQDASKSSTALRTITARIRNTKAELEDLGEEIDENYNTTAKYRKELLALANVDILDENSEFRSTFDIISDLSDAWGDLGSKEKAAITQMVAGTRGLNVFSSLMENFDIAAKVMEEVGNSAGFMDEKYEAYTNSIEAANTRLKNSWDELATHILSSDFTVGFVNLLATGLTKLNDLLTPDAETERLHHAYTHNTFEDYFGDIQEIDKELEEFQTKLKDTDDRVSKLKETQLTKGYSEVVAQEIDGLQAESAELLYQITILQQRRDLLASNVVQPLAQSKMASNEFDYHVILDTPTLDKASGELQYTVKKTGSLNDAIDSNKKTIQTAQTEMDFLTNCVNTNAITFEEYTEKMVVWMRIQEEAAQDLASIMSQLGNAIPFLTGIGKSHAQYQYETAQKISDETAKNARENYNNFARARAKEEIKTRLKEAQAIYDAKQNEIKSVGDLRENEYKGKSYKQGQVDVQEEQLTGGGGGKPITVLSSKDITALRTLASAYTLVDDSGTGGGSQPWVDKEYQWFKDHGMSAQIDLTNRPIVHGWDMRYGGYTDFLDDEFATVYSSIYSNAIGNQHGIFTPISQGGEVFSKDFLDEYASLYFQTGEDPRGLLLAVTDNLTEAIYHSEMLHKAQAQTYKDVRADLAQGVMDASKIAWPSGSQLRYGPDPQAQLTAQQARYDAEQDAIKYIEKQHAAENAQKARYDAEQDAARYIAGQQHKKSAGEEWLEKPLFGGSLVDWANEQAVEYQKTESQKAAERAVTDAQKARYDAEQHAVKYLAEQQRTKSAGEVWLEQPLFSSGADNEEHEPRETIHVSRGRSGQHKQTITLKDEEVTTEQQAAALTSVGDTIEAELTNIQRKIRAVETAMYNPETGTYNYGLSSVDLKAETGFDTYGDYYQYLKDRETELLNADDGIRKAFEESKNGTATFDTMQKAATNVAEVLTDDAQQAFIETFNEAAEEDLKESDFQVKDGDKALHHKKEYPSIGDLREEYYSTKSVYDEWLDSLTDEDWEIVLKWTYNTESGKPPIEDLKDFVEKAKQISAEENLIDIDVSSVETALKNYTDKRSALSQALANQKNGYLTTTDLNALGDEYASAYTYDSGHWAINEQLAMDIQRQQAQKAYTTAAEQMLNIVKNEQAIREQIVKLSEEGTDEAKQQIASERDKLDIYARQARQIQVMMDQISEMSSDRAAYSAAKSTENADKNIESMRDSLLSDLQTGVKTGGMWTDDYTSAVKYVLGEDADYTTKQGNEAIKKVKKYSAKEGKGYDAAREDLMRAGILDRTGAVARDANGYLHTVQDAADALGVSKDYMYDILNMMKVYGAQWNYTDEYWSDMVSKADTLEGTFATISAAMAAGADRDNLISNIVKSAGEGEGSVEKLANAYASLVKNATEGMTDQGEIDKVVGQIQESFGKALGDSGISLDSIIDMGEGIDWSTLEPDPITIEIKTNPEDPMSLVPGDTSSTHTIYVRRVETGSRDPDTGYHPSSANFGDLFTGNANITGTAYIGGKWGSHTGTHRALVGELGQELMVDPNTGTWRTIGDHGPEIITVPDDAIIFNDMQTKGILAGRSVYGRGQMMHAAGTAHLTGFADKRIKGWDAYRKPKNTGGSSSSSSEPKKNLKGKDDDLLSEEYKADKAMLEHQLDLISDMLNLYHEGSEDWFDQQSNIIDTYSKAVKLAQIEYEGLIGEGYDASFKSMRELAEQIIDWQNEIFDAQQDYWDAQKDNATKTLEHLDKHITSIVDLKEAHYDLINSIQDEEYALRKEMQIAKDAYPYLTDAERQAAMNDEDYAYLLNKLSKISKEASGMYEDYLAQIEEVGEDASYELDRITNELQIQYDLKMKEYATAKSELAVLKARKNLENVMQEKSVATLVGGMWVWEADSENVKQAMEELSDAELEYAKSVREQMQGEDIATLETYSSEVQAQIDAIDAAIFSMDDLAKEVHDLKDAIWAQILENLSDKGKRAVDENTTYYQTYADEAAEALAKLIADNDFGATLMSAYTANLGRNWDAAQTAAATLGNTSTTDDHSTTVYIGDVRLDSDTSSMIITALRQANALYQV